jgi:Methylamine utilisation protein MauE
MSRQAVRTAGACKKVLGEIRLSRSMAMTGAGLLLAGCYALAVALLLRSSALKAASPHVTADALAEVFPRLSGRPLSRNVRLAAGIELLAALAITAPHLRLAAWVLAGLLGACFAALGTVGLVRGSTRPCGCFGADGDRPLGWMSMLTGAALLALAVVSVADRRDALTVTAHAGTAAAAAVIALAWTLASHRKEAVQVVGYMRYRSAPALASGSPERPEPPR